MIFTRHDRVAYTLDQLRTDPYLTPTVGTVLEVGDGGVRVLFDRQDTTTTVDQHRLRKVPADREAHVLVEGLTTVARFRPGCRCYFTVTGPPGAHRPALIWNNCPVCPRPERTPR